MYTYIQSRYYRAPEVILGVPYTTSIDVWSLGCVLFELYTGTPLFPGENESDQLLCIIEILGSPPIHLSMQAQNWSCYFDDCGQAKSKFNSRGLLKQAGSRSLSNILKVPDADFYSLIDSCLKWDPEDRIKAEVALNSPYFKDPSAPSSINKLKHKKISLEDITKHVPNLQKFIAHRKRLSQS